MKEITSLDRLALSRAQHLEYREKNDDDDEELSDWSDSDRECCPVSDGEFDDENFLPTTTTRTTATPIFIERKATPIVEYTKKITKTPLLPARRLLPSRNRQNRTQSINSSALSHEEITRGPTASPNLSQTSVSRLYETKKSFIDDTDYGRLTDISTLKSLRPSSRQKWGTIVHPPFPLGYQQVSPDHVHHVVERLTSPSRSRDRRTPSQSPSKRFLSVEETEALVSFLSFASFQ